MNEEPIQHDTKSFRGSFLVYRKRSGNLRHPGQGGRSRPPRFRHPNFASAEVEARRLLTLHPESTFVILQEVARVKRVVAEVVA